MSSNGSHAIALYLPGSVSALISYGRHVVESMTDNPWFPDPQPPLSTLTETLDALATADAIAQGGGQGTATARKTKQRKVANLLIKVKQYVRDTAIDDPDDAETIIRSAGMTPMPFTRYHKPEIAAVPGPVPNEAIVRAKAVGKGAAYEWQYSTDGGEKWLAMGMTTSANIKMQNLAPGTHLFRFRSLRQNELSAWSSTATLVMR